MKTEVNNPCCICQSVDSKLLFETKYQEHKYPGIFSIRQCKGCDLIFNSPRLNDQELAYLYGQNYYFFHRKDAVEFKRIIVMYQRTVGLLDEKDIKKSVVEIGSAKGYFLSVLSKLGWKTQGIEISPQASKFSREQLGLLTYTGTLEQYVQEKNMKTYPLVVAIDLIEHVSDPVKFIQSAAKITDKDGYFLIDTPNGSAFNISTEGVKWQGFNPFHIFLFSAKNLSRILEENGFIVEKAFSYGNIRRKQSVGFKGIVKEKIIAVLSFLRILNIFRLVKNINISGKVINFYQEETVKVIKELGDYSSTSDASGELAQRFRGDNIIMVARKI